VSIADVTIVGAGPVGLMLANLLGSSGHRVVVLEREPTPVDEPRAVSIDDEAMRTLQTAGLSGAAERLVVPGTGTKYLSGRGHLLTYAKPARLRRGFAVKNPVHQPDLVRLLLDHARDHANVDVRFAHRVRNLTPDVDTVGIDVATPDGPTLVRSRFVVGCDGGRSTIRQAMRIELSGSSFEQRWLVIDVAGDHHDERYAMHHGDPRRPHVIVPGRDGRCRYEFMVLDSERSDDVVGLAFVQQVLAPYRRVDPADIERCAVYTFHALVAERWRVGSVFLAGDAAHMMPPFAGQGLNTGFRDVHNLAWKLDLTLRGIATARLLDTYELERRPHARAMVELSTKVGSVVMTTDIRKAALRDALARAALAVGPARRFLAEMRFKPPPRFDHGLLLRHARLAGGDPAGRMIDQPSVLTACGERVLLDEVLGPGFALLAADRDGSSAIDRLADPRWEHLGVRRVRAVLGDRMPSARLPWSVADYDGALERVLSGAPHSVWLIRPDRYVVGVFAPHEESVFLDRLAAFGLVLGERG
jgi:3-(3-hydroxy-phenyl)propionate hydroxylase